MTWRRHLQLHVRDYLVLVIIVMILLAGAEWAHREIREQIDIPSTTLVVDGP